MDSPKSSPIFEALSDIEGATVPLDEISNMLFLFEELLRNSVEEITPEEPWTVIAFKNRFDTLISMLTMAEGALRAVIQNNGAAISKAYSVRHT